MTTQVTEFFNNLWGVLVIELSQPAVVIGGLTNQKAAANTEIVDVALEVKVYKDDEFQLLTPEELSNVAYDAPAITIKGAAGIAVRHVAPNKSFFTVANLVEAVGETERQTRKETEWFGGVDVHHIFFEGLSRGADGRWKVNWGS